LAVAKGGVAIDMVVGGPGEYFNANESIGIDLVVVQVVVVGSIELQPKNIIAGEDAIVDMYVSTVQEF
jgi:hypothetical protein